MKKNIALAVLALPALFLGACASGDKDQANVQYQDLGSGSTQATTQPQPANGQATQAADQSTTTTTQTSTSTTAPATGSTYKPWSPNTPAANTGTTPATNYPKGIVVPGKKGFVRSPFAEHAGLVDVQGFPSGTPVKCPYTGKIFIVP